MANNQCMCVFYPGPIIAQYQPWMSKKTGLRVWSSCVEEKRCMRVEGVLKRMILRVNGIAISRSKY